MHVFANVKEAGMMEGTDLLQRGDARICPKRRGRGAKASRIPDKVDGLTWGKAIRKDLVLVDKKSKIWVLLKIISQFGAFVEEIWKFGTFVAGNLKFGVLMVFRESKIMYTVGTTGRHLRGLHVVLFLLCRPDEIGNFTRRRWHPSPTRAMPPCYPCTWGHPICTNSIVCGCILFT